MHARDIDVVHPASKQFPTLAKRLVLSLALFLLLAAGCTVETVTPGGEREPTVGYGAPTAAHPFVGQLEVLVQGKWLGWCSASLIAPRLVLTAAHCIQLLEPRFGVTAFDAASLRLRLETGAYPLAPDGIGLPAGYVPALASRPGVHAAVVASDIAVLVLGEAVVGVEPGLLASRLPELHEEVTVVGYGITEQGVFDDGIKREGTSVVCLVPGVEGTDYPVYETCARPAELPGNEGFTGDPARTWAFICSGDSGGPTLDAAGAILGVHSTSTCTVPIASRIAGWPATDTAVLPFATWLGVWIDNASRWAAGPAPLAPSAPDLPAPGTPPAGSSPSGTVQCQAGAPGQPCGPGMILSQSCLPLCNTCSGGACCVAGTLPCVVSGSCFPCPGYGRP